MKIDMAESLCYSYLRHVKKCWLVQTNWKVSEHWTKNQSDRESEQLFWSMRNLFDSDGNVFKKTTGAQQFLKQGEIDVLGIDRNGSVYAIDVAFHRAGLNYGKSRERVLKKLLRMVMPLKTYAPEQPKPHIYFVSPKVNLSTQEPLEQDFEKLEKRYQEFYWHLFTNDKFVSNVVQPTIEKAGSVDDTAELFMRAGKLLDLTGITFDDKRPNMRAKAVPEQNVVKETAPYDTDDFRPLVKHLMKTLLEDYPRLLDDKDHRNMRDNEYCKKELHLRIGNYPLLRLTNDGRKDKNGHNRFWKEIYGNQFYVCSQWASHRHNARSLERFVARLIQERTGHQGVDALKEHLAAFQSYAG